MKQIWNNAPTINPNNGLFSDKLPHKYQKLIPSLISIGIPTDVKRGDIIISEGFVCNFFYLIDSGVFRVYRLVDGDEITYGFTFKGDIDSCPFSFFNQTPANETIEALTDGKIIKIYRSEYNNMIVRNLEYVELATYLLTSYIDVIVNRIVTLKKLTAEEQYSLLLRQQPHEINRIPLKYIASYLGVSPARLSRIRKSYLS